jgi:hypothetical protein
MPCSLWRFDREFDLAVMTGHAFQVFVSDDELRFSLAAIRRALVDGGRFAFETRNPLARACENWTPRNATTLVDPSGGPVRVSHDVESVVADVVTLTETTSDPDGLPVRVDRANLRFLDVDTLTGFLANAGFEIEVQYGGWFRDRGPVRRLASRATRAGESRDHYYRPGLAPDCSNQASRARRLAAVSGLVSALARV